MGPTHSGIDNAFTNHPASPETVELHNAVRENCKTIAHWFLEYLPESPERTLAINKLREAMMWGNAAIACNKRYEDPIHPGEEMTGASEPVDL